MPRKRAPNSKGTMGNIPPNATGILIAPDLFDTGNTTDPLYGWRLYMTAGAAEPWLNLKMVRHLPSAGLGAPGNYWLGWNTAENRFSGHRDTLRMPDVMRDALAAFLSNADGSRYGKLSDFSMDFYRQCLIESDADLNDMMS
jgi:hypothetical protein